MKIGILQTGLTPDGVDRRHGQYLDIFRRFLAPHDPALDFANWAVVQGELPEDPGAADAWLITGSRHGVYEDHAWIPPLKAFLRACRAAEAPMIGVCFGHQIMAEALGGAAEKFHGGWGLGPSEYEMLEAPGWVPPAPPRLCINAVHQDQVTRLAPDATRIARSDFCENAALLYGDPARPYGISIQPHPEFDDAFVSDLFEARRAAFPADRLAAARARIGRPLDQDWAARWFLDFLDLRKPK